MTYQKAEKVWERINELMMNDPELKEYRPVIEHIDCNVLNSYRVSIREIYDFVKLERTKV